MPLITLTLRKATPNRLELRYAETTTQVTLKQVDLAPFEGEWVEVIETVEYGEIGTYSININKVSDGTSLLSYSNVSIRMWKTMADFIRPKWGIYRSLNNSLDLRNEEVLFANFSITEFPPLPVELIDFKASLFKDDKARLEWSTASETNNDYFEIERSSNGIDFRSLGKVSGNGTTTLASNYEYLDQSPPAGTQYYRLKQVDFDGQFSYSDIKSVNLSLLNNQISLFPNPGNEYVFIQSKSNIKMIRVYNTLGVDCTPETTIHFSTSNSLQLDITELESGLFFIEIEMVDNGRYSQALLKG